jgi:hypothetical protein
MTPKSYKLNLGQANPEKNHSTHTSVRECWLARSAPLGQVERA